MCAMYEQYHRKETFIFISSREFIRSPSTYPLTTSIIVHICVPVSLLTYSSVDLCDSLLSLWNIQSWRINLQVNFPSLKFLWEFNDRDFNCIYVFWVSSCFQFHCISTFWELYTSYSIRLASLFLESPLNLLFHMPVSFFLSLASARMTKSVCSLWNI